jgi:hypothetical protein
MKLNPQMNGGLLGLDSMILEEKPLNDENLELKIQNSFKFFRATRSPKTISFPQFIFHINDIHGVSEQIDLYSQITSNSEAESNRHGSSLMDILSSLEENITKLIVDINTKIVYINLFNE